MTKLIFKKTAPRDYKGETPTHWTCESMRHCTCMSGGAVATTPAEAVRLALVETYVDGDDGSEFEYIDADHRVGWEVFGLVQVGKEYFWTGHIKKATARVVVSIDGEG